MRRIAEGDAAPDVVAEDQHGRRFALAELRGKSPVVLFFYPQDNTPVCTWEACRFRDAFEEFVAAGATVVGVSSDSVQRHQAFATQYQLPFVLLADVDGALRRAFGVPKSLGLLPGRVTYVIDREGIVRRIIRATLDAPKHVREALTAVNAMTQGDKPQA